ncbi:MAG TPA: hypothetical protein VGT42_04945 [Gammaproteobacteria bacterium]|nr:hypothetical protein [Gammaproteobacteria bacterium]
MPLTAKGRKILRNMEREYGPAKGRAVFYASINKGRISGAETGTGDIRETPRKHRHAH